MSAAAGMVTEMNTPMRAPDAVQVQVRRLARRPYGHAEGERQYDGGGEPGGQRDRAVARGAAFPLADQVTDTGELREPVEQPAGEARRGHEADVQHQLRGVAEGSPAAVGPAVVAGLAAACAAVGGFGASAGAAGAILAAAT